MYTDEMSDSNDGEDSGIYDQHRPRSPSVFSAYNRAFEQKNNNLEPDDGERPKKIPKIERNTPEDEETVENAQAIIEEVPAAEHNSVPVKETKIDTLDETCLVHILKWLDFPDLLTAANATKALNEAAGKIFAEEYASKSVKYNGDVVGTKGLEIEVTKDSIEINKSRTCLFVLRGFGSAIRRISLNFDQIGPRRINAITSVLNDCCADTLLDLEWKHCPKNVMAQNSEPFKKLQRLRLFNGVLGEELTQFNRMFPALRILVMCGVEVTERKCIEILIPNLNDLKVGIETRKGKDFLKSNVKAALKANPQLKCLTINAGCDLKLLKYVNSTLPRLETLEIQNPRNKLFSSDEKIICFEEVKSFILDVAESKDTFTHIPFSFKRLKMFKVHACAKFRDEWIDFAVQNRQLVDLRLMNYHWFYILKREKLMKLSELPDLKRFILDWRVDSADVLTQFIKQCPGLKKIRLSMRTRPERAALFAEIGSDWKIEINEQYMYLDRVDEGTVLDADMEITSSSFGQALSNR